MNVVIVTGKAPHHKRLCVMMVKTFRVVGIIHPAKTTTRPPDRIRRLIKRAGSYGWSLTTMYLLAKLLSKNSSQPEREAAGDDEKEGYDRIPHSLIHDGCDVRQASTRELLRSLHPDVTVCLGGPVYPPDFINVSPLMLNFHSGISPVYNGTASIPFAFANGHPHLCGGTLMLMDPVLDGGRILGHFLPEIKSGDSPDSLFRKTVQGAAVMYGRLLKHLQSEGRRIHHIPQAPPLFFTRGFDFGCYHLARIRQHLRSDLPARYGRTESVVEYWRQPTHDAACRLYDNTLTQLLWKTSVSDITLCASTQNQRGDFLRSRVRAVK